MKCTAPCVPPCEEEATTELLSLTGSHLGFNCDKHIKPLRFEAVGNLPVEYKKRPMTPEQLAA
jgi:hypothetical protein